MDDLKEFIAKRQVKRIISKYRDIIIDTGSKDDMYHYTSVFDDEISQLSQDALGALNSITGSAFYDDDPPESSKYKDKQEFLNVFKHMKTRTEKTILAFRGGYLKQDPDVLYPTSMSPDEALKHTSAGYKELNCILIEKGTVIVPTASVCRARNDGIDSEYELVILSNNLHKEASHLWIYLP